MEGDVHNLIPPIDEVNADRKLQIRIDWDERRIYGHCDTEVDFKQRVFEPSVKTYENIARTYGYLELKYGLRISKK